MLGNHSITLCTPTLRRYDLLTKMLLSAEAGTLKPDKYIVVDNGTGQQSYNDAGWEGYLKHNKIKLPFMDKVKLVKPSYNWGCAKSWNYFIKNNDDYVVIANDDIELNENTLETLVKAAIDNPDEIFFTCRGDQNAFSLFLITKKCLELIGPFDENFWPAYYEDNDYVKRMRLAGYDHICVPGCHYWHEGSGTVKAKSARELQEHNKNFKKSSAYYVRKWGGLPYQEKYDAPFNKSELKITNKRKVQTNTESLPPQGKLSWQNVEGWFDYEPFYNQIADWAKTGMHLVEVGSWQGQSAICLAQKLQERGKKVRFDCVDIWNADWLLAKFKDNIKRAEVDQDINMVNFSSEEASRIYRDESLDFVYIDADHSYESTLGDIKLWLPKVKPGGILAGHDYHSDHPGVIRAVDEFFGSSVEILDTVPNKNVWFYSKPILKSKVSLDIITPVSRIENLPLIYESIDRQRSHFDIRWIVVFDSSKPYTISESTIRLLADKSWILTNQCSGTGVSGNDQRNLGLNFIRDGFVYFLDDDNLLHPNFARLLYHYTEAHPEAKAFVFSQERDKGQTFHAKPQNMKHACIDTAQFILHSDIVLGKWPEKKYDADWFFIEAIYSKHKDSFVFIDEVLSYYNKLRREG